MPDKQPKDERPSVRLLFSIGDNSIEIERDLFDSHIKFLSINGELYREDETSNIEEIYSQEILRLSGISSLDDYKDLLGKLLIREEGTNLLTSNLIVVINLVIPDANSCQTSLPNPKLWQLTVATKSNTK